MVLRGQWHTQPSGVRCAGQDKEPGVLGFADFQVFDSPFGGQRVRALFRVRQVEGRNFVAELHRVFWWQQQVTLDDCGQDESAFDTNQATELLPCIAPCCHVKQPHRHIRPFCHPKWKYHCEIWQPQDQTCHSATTNGNQFAT